MKAAIYTRYSSQGQNPLSCKDQEDVCRVWCKENGYEVVAVYADEAISGRTDKRPQLQKMVLDAQGSGWDAVVVYKLDRFSRNRYDSALYRRKLEPVKVVSAMENIPEDASGIILEGMLDAVNEWYSANLSELTKRGMKAGAERCEALGVAVYGYDIVDGRYVVNEEQAEVVRYIYDMALDGCSVGMMLDELKRAGATTSTGRPPSYTFLHQMLHNPKYAGVYVWGDIVVEDGMPAIIERWAWDKVQEANLHRKPASKGKRADYWLYGSAYCQHGHLLTGESAQSGKYHYYICKECGLRIRKEKLEEMVGAMARDAMAPEMAEAVVDAMIAFDESSGRAKEREELKHLITKGERTVSRLVSAIEAGVDPKDVKDRIEDEKRLIRAHKAALEEMEEEMPPRDVLLAGYHLVREEGDDRQVATTFVRTVVVTPDVVAASFNFDGAPISVEEVLADIEKRPDTVEGVRPSKVWLPIVGTGRITMVGTWRKSA